MSITPLIKAIEALRGHLAQIGNDVLSALNASGRAYLTLDFTAIDGILNKRTSIEKDVDDFEAEILKVLALHHPVAHDLRRIVTFLKVSSDVERMGALTGSIGKKTRTLAVGTPVQVPQEFQDQIERAMVCVKTVVELIRTENTKLVEVIKSTDQEIERNKRQLRQKIESMLGDDPKEAEHYIAMLGVSRHLDRISSLCSQICDDMSALKV